MTRRYHLVFALIIVGLSFSPCLENSALALDVSVYTDKQVYFTGDKIKVDFSISGSTENASYDLYIALLVPSQEIYFFPGWIKYMTSIRIPLSAGYYLPRTNLFQFSIPNGTPPIGAMGDYMFATGAAIPGTSNFVSGIKTASFSIIDKIDFSCYTNGNSANKLAYLNGYLLSSTTGGLIIWDLQNNSYVKMTTKNGLPGGDVRDIILDPVRQGAWVATNGGVGFFNGAKWTNYTMENGLDSNDILSIILDKNNNLWCGTYGFGINVLSNGNVIAKYNSTNTLRNDVILSLTKDLNDVIWIGTEDGAAAYDGSNFTLYTTLINAGINGSIIRSIDVDKDNKKYFAVADAFDYYGGNGVSVFDGSAWIYYWGMPSDPLLDERVYDVYPASNGDIWFGTRFGVSRRSSDGNWSSFARGSWVNALTGGDNKEYFSISTSDMGLIDQEGVTYFHTKNEPVGNNISSITADQNGNLWLGTNQPIIGGNGISMFDGETFVNYDIDYLSNNIRSIASDHDDVIYAGTDNGLAYFKNGVWDLYNENDGLISNDIKSVVVDFNNSVWIGTSSGLSRLNQGNWTSYTTEDGLPGNEIVDLYVDTFGKLWVASTTGVGIYNNGNWTKVLKNGEAFTDWMFSIAVDSDGIGWGGLYENIVKIDLSKTDDQVEYIGYSAQLNDILKMATVTDIAIGKDATVWFSTDLNGVIGYGVSGIRYIKTKNGLLSNEVNTLFVDSAGKLWCGTFNGLITFTNP
jgi:ligand-binding sensor domain-containing protein